MPDLIAGPPKRAPRVAPSIAGSINPNMFAGESEAMMRMGANIQRAGGQFGDFLMRRRYADYANQVNDGKLALQQFNSDFEERLATDTDYETQANRYDQELKQFSEDYLNKVKSPKAKNELTRDFAFYGDKKELGIFTEARKKIIRKIDASQPELIKINVGAGLDVALDDDIEAERVRIKIRDSYKKDLDSHVAAGIMTREKADFWMHERARAIGLEAIRRSPETAAEVFEGGDIDVLMCKDDLKLLDQVDIEYLRNRAASQVNFTQLQQKKALEAGQAQAEEEIWDIARTGDVNGVADKIDTYPFDAEWKKKQLGDAMRTANLLKEDKPNPYTTVSDPEKYWTNYTKVLIDPDSMTNAEITAMVPDICGITQAQSILNLKKTKEDDPLKSPQAKMYLKGLEDLHLVKDLMNAVQWDKANRALMNHIEKNPDEPPEKLYSFYKQLVDPYVKAKWKKVLEWLSDLGDVDTSGSIYSMQKKYGSGKSIKELNRLRRADQEDTEPRNVGEFEFEVQRMAQSDKKAAREYYDKWAGKW